jgi:2-oxoglutarate dehydrogenase E2 component (dihydrolipoamide succinyltransferase)
MIEISVPKLNANDNTYHLVEWLYADGEQVRNDEPVAVVETSKAVEEIVAPGDGVLHQAVQAPRELAMGAVIGRIFGSDEDRRRFLAGAPEQAAVPDSSPPEVVLTKPALTLAAELGIAPERLRALDRPVVRRADVLELAAGTVPGTMAGAVAGTEVGAAGGAAPTEPPTDRSDQLTLPRSQAAVAATVIRSHTTIPAAFTVVKVAVDAALAFGRACTRANGALIGLPEILIAALGRQRSHFPLLFAAPLDGLTVRPGPADVGVTIDVGTGLYVPVVRAVDRQSLRDIAGTMMRFRLTAMRGSFAERDLTGASIMLSLTNDDDVVHTQPIVAPGQLCALSIGGVQYEIAPGGAHGGDPADPTDGNPKVRAVVHLGASYDHRYVNGGDAVRFLRAVKAAVERPEPLDQAPGAADEGTDEA